MFDSWAEVTIVKIVMLTEWYFLIVETCVLLKIDNNFSILLRDFYKEDTTILRRFELLKQGISLVFN